MEITKDKLKKITGIIDDTKLEGLLKGLQDVVVKYSINTPLRMAHFLAQLMHESNNFTAVKENLNYSAKALMATWPKRFTAELAKASERNPEKIGNIAYASRMGNGDIKSGDGYKFRGRGFIQITGKDNYTAVGKALGLDLIKNPELLETLTNALVSGAWYWNSRKLNAVADLSPEKVDKVTTIVNGGTNGLKDRQDHFDKIYKILK